ncbi:MAG TPA: hypothetical protein DEP87_02980 [Candidatus Pacebacteria bacterium]|nr:hypothetical protein [Candidatus Paceibacterota bacterium]
MIQTKRWLWRTKTTTTPELWLQPGLTLDQQTELLQLSQSDFLVRKTTHDATRFGSVKALENWLGQPHEILSLISPQNHLLGIVWLSQKSLPELVSAELLFQPSVELTKYQLTFAIRLYAQVRGQGLAKPLLEAAFEYFSQTPLWQAFPTGQLWLQTQATNLPAKKVYQSLGFRQFTPADNEGEIVMLKTAVALQ